MTKSESNHEVSILLTAYESSRSNIRMHVQSEHNIPVVVLTVFAAALAISKETATKVLFALSPFVVAGIYFLWAHNHYALLLQLAYSYAVAKRLQEIGKKQIFKPEETIGSKLQAFNKQYEMLPATIGSTLLVFIFFAACTYFGATYFSELISTTTLSQKIYWIGVALSISFVVWTHFRQTQFLDSRFSTLVKQFESDIKLNYPD